MSAAAVPQTLAQTAETGSRREGRRRRFGNGLIVAGLAIIGAVVLFCAVYPLVSGYDPTAPALSETAFAPPSWSHLLGTDNFGRDTLTRLAAGGRLDLAIATSATLGTVLVGGVLGLLSGFHGGRFDTLLMRLVDVMLTLPYLVLVIAIVAILGTGPVNILYAVLIVGWVTYARLVRGETMVARRLEYVEAARVVGMGNGRIMLRHILPNVVTAAIVYSMADVVLNILLATTLSFLGLGVRPGEPEWGMMVNDARDFFLKDAWLMTYPGLAVMITGAGFGLLGDGLAQALRPKG